MLRFKRFFSGKFQNLENCAGVKHLTNIMCAVRKICVKLNSVCEITHQKFTYKKIIRIFGVVQQQQQLLLLTKAQHWSRRL